MSTTDTAQGDSQSTKVSVTHLSNYEWRGLGNIRSIVFEVHPVEQAPPSGTFWNGNATSRFENLVTGADRSSAEAWKQAIRTARTGGYSELLLEDIGGDKISFREETAPPQHSRNPADYHVKERLRSCADQRQISQRRHGQAQGHDELLSSLHSREP